MPPISLSLAVLTLHDLCLTYWVFFLSLIHGVCGCEYIALLLSHVFKP